MHLFATQVPRFRNTILKNSLTELLSAPLVQRSNTRIKGWILQDTLSVNPKNCRTICTLNLLCNTLTFVSFKCRDTFRTRNALVRSVLKTSEVFSDNNKHHKQEEARIAQINDSIKDAQRTTATLIYQGRVKQHLNTTGRRAQPTLRRQGCPLLGRHQNTRTYNRGKAEASKQRETQM